MKRLELDLDEIVIDGVPERDARLLVQAFRETLERIVSGSEGGAGEVSVDRDILRISPRPGEWPSNPAAAGRYLARAIRSAIAPSAEPKMTHAAPQPSQTQRLT